VSSSVVPLDVLLKLSPDHLLLEFLAQCGLSLPRSVADTDDHTLNTLRIAAAIQRAAAAVRECVVASLRRIARLVDAAGRQALRAVNEMQGGRVSALRFANAPAQCALWMYLRHRDLFDAAVRLRESAVPCLEPLPLEALRQPLAAPEGLVVDRVRLYEATLFDEATGGQIAIMAPEGDPRIGVLELLDLWMPGDNPMRQARFRLITAKLDVAFFPEPGQAVGRSATIALRRVGGSNLDEFDPDIRAHVESWLMRWCLILGRDAQAAATPSQIPV
jgi:hypothetical protein